MESFGIIGMTFGIVGMTFGIVALAKLVKLEKHLIESGFLDQNYKK
jgi:hypothetical protein